MGSLKSATRSDDTIVVNELNFASESDDDDLVTTPSFYEVLEVPENAEEVEIDHAFARALQEPHSDPRVNAARKHAWEVLRDPVNRSFYDEYLAKIRAKAIIASAAKPFRGVGSMSTFTLGADLQNSTAEAPESSRNRRSIRKAS